MNRREFLRKSLVGIVAGSIPLISGCGKNPVNSELNPIIKDNIEYYIQTEKKDYRLGENVGMLYRVTNLGDEDVRFDFPHSPEWNFWVEKDGKAIWKAVDGWYMISNGFTLSPNNSKVFEYIWDMKDNENILVNAGKYSVIGGFDAGVEENYVHTKVSTPININPK